MDGRFISGVCKSVLRSMVILVTLVSHTLPDVGETGEESTLIICPLSLTVVLALVVEAVIEY